MVIQVHVICKKEKEIQGAFLTFSLGCHQVTDNLGMFAGFIIEAITS